MVHNDLDFYRSDECFDNDMFESGCIWNKRFFETWSNLCTMSSWSNPTSCVFDISQHLSKRLFGQRHGFGEQLDQPRAKLQSFISEIDQWVGDLDDCLQRAIHRMASLYPSV